MSLPVSRSDKAVRLISPSLRALSTVRYWTDFKSVAHWRSWVDAEFQALRGQAQQEPRRHQAAAPQAEGLPGRLVPLPGCAPSTRPTWGQAARCGAVTLAPLAAAKLQRRGVACLQPGPVLAPAGV
jgi:hypothetical protein